MIPHTNEIKAKHKFFLVDVGSSKNILTHNFIFLTQGFKLCGTVRFWNGYKLLDSSSKVMGCTRSIENNKLWSVLLPIMVQMVIKKKPIANEEKISFHFSFSVRSKQLRDIYPSGLPSCILLPETEDYRKSAKE